MTGVSQVPMYYIICQTTTANRIKTLSPSSYSTATVLKGRDEISGPTLQPSLFYWDDASFVFWGHLKFPGHFFLLAEQNNKKGCLLFFKSRLSLRSGQECGSGSVINNELKDPSLSLKSHQNLCFESVGRSHTGTAADTHLHKNVHFFTGKNTVLIRDIYHFLILWVSHPQCSELKTKYWF